MNKMSFLKQALLNNRLNIQESIQQKILSFVELLLKWNKTFNLTAICDFDSAVYLHVVDSLLIHPYLKDEKILDVGSGAGLPGIPLALFFPEKKFTLLDSNGKKTRFIQQAVLELNIKNIEMIHSRVENYRPFELFNQIMTRAFSNLNDMILQTQHLLTEQGQILAMKGVYPSEEIAALPQHFNQFSVYPLPLHGIVATRHLVCMRRREAWQK